MGQDTESRRRDEGFGVYQLQGRANISSGSWQNIGAAQGGTSVTNNDGSISGTVLNFSDTGGATGLAKFYRIQVSP